MTTGPGPDEAAARGARRLLLRAPSDPHRTPPSGPLAVAADSTWKSPVPLSVRDSAACPRCRPLALTIATRFVRPGTGGRRSEIVGKKVFVGNLSFETTSAHLEVDRGAGRGCR